MKTDVKLTSMVKTSGCAAKLPPEKLHRVIDNLPLMKSDKLLEGFESADDALVYSVTDDIVSVQTVDFFPPMVDDPFIFGEVAAANALSDVYAMGGEPAVAMNLLCFPSCLELDVMDKILRGGIQKVKEAGAVIAGGHTIADPTPKYGLCVTGYMKKDEVWSNSGAKVGDVVVLTKALGVGIVHGWGIQRPLSAEGRNPYHRFHSTLHPGPDHEPGHRQLQAGLHKPACST